MEMTWNKRLAWGLESSQVSDFINHQQAHLGEGFNQPWQVVALGGLGQFAGHVHGVDEVGAVTGLQGFAGQSDGQVGFTHSRWP